MALKDNLSRKRSKRFSCVSITSEEMNFSSSNCGDDSPKKPKVRGKSSIRRLMKQGENFKVDDDHIYTTSKTFQNGDLVNVSKYNTSARRHISEDSDERPAKQKCSSKNAIMARMNRERKKKYVSSLEDDNKRLSNENSILNEKIESQNKLISSLRNNLLYVKSLLANSKELSQILNNLKEITGLPVTSSLSIAHEDYMRNENSSEEQSNKLRSPRTKTVIDGPNFPIMDKDINLSISSYTSLPSGFLDCESPPFDFENEFYENNNFSIESSVFNFDTVNLGLELDEHFKIDDSNNDMPDDAGICVHIKKKQISLELCSICNKNRCFSNIIN